VRPSRTGTIELRDCLLAVLGLVALFLIWLGGAWVKIQVLRWLGWL
jgi:hypothetical protein